MKVIDGIAYADTMTDVLEVRGIKALDNYLLWIRFSNGETKTIDFKPLLDNICFNPLKDIEEFKKVYIDYGIPTWNDGEIDISPEFLYEMEALEL